MDQQFDEQSLRRSDFQGGRPVKLADGQEWVLPLPVVSLVPVRLPSGQVACEAATQFGPEFDRLLDDLAEASTVAEDASALQAIGDDLLSRNYTLTGDQRLALLVYQLNPDGPGDAMDAIRDIALGYGPKA